MVFSDLDIEVLSGSVEVEVAPGRTAKGSNTVETKCRLIDVLFLVLPYLHYNFQKGTVVSLMTCCREIRELLNQSTFKNEMLFSSRITMV